MARERDWEALTDRYRRRLERAGVTREGYLSGRANLQRARGHRPREHLTRVTRAGTQSLSARDRDFVRRQGQRSGQTPEAIAEARRIFTRKSPEARERLIRSVQAARNEWRERGRPFREPVRDAEQWRREIAGGGVDQYVDEYSEPEDFDEYDDLPEWLTFYHDD